MGGNDLFTGTLELLVLRVLASGPEHGFGIGKILREDSSGVLDVAEGVLYPALHRLENRGLLRSEWKKTPAGRRAKVYALTDDGVERLEAMEAEWSRFRSAVASIGRAGEEASA